MQTIKVKRYHLKKELKNVIRGSLVAVVAIMLVMPILNANAQAEQEAMDYCMQKNNNYNYCINGLRG